MNWIEWIKCIAINDDNDEDDDDGPPPRCVCASAVRGSISCLFICISHVLFVCGANRIGFYYSNIHSGIIISIQGYAIRVSIVCWLLLHCKLLYRIKFYNFCFSCFIQMPFVVWQRRAFQIEYYCVLHCGVRAHALCHGMPSERFLCAFNYLVKKIIHA